MEVAAVEKSLGLSEETPSESEMLFPVHELSVELLDGSTRSLRVKPWGLGRFVQAQTVVAELLSSYQQTFAGIDLSQLGETLSQQMVLRVINLLTPHIRDLLYITLGADGTFEKAPQNLRSFVNELPLAVSVRISIIMLRQNWRHLKNVLGLVELDALKELISARPSST